MGHLKILPVVAADHAELYAEAMDRCREAAIDLAGGLAANYCDDPTVCAGCWCRSKGICAPPMEFPDASIVDDEALIGMLDELGPMTETGKAYAALDRKMKSRVKEIHDVAGADSFLAGPYVVQVKTSKRTAYDIPADIKAQYATKAESRRVTFERLES